MGQQKIISSKSGFTLIELMIVVAIIGILASIAIPQFQQFIAKSRRTEGVTLLSAFHKAEISYFAENDVFAFPPGAAPTQGIPTQLGFEALGQPKYYFLTDAPPYDFNMYIPDSTDHSTYLAILKGNIDRDVNIDWLCVFHPSNGLFPAWCPQGPGVVGPFIPNSPLDDLAN